MPTARAIAERVEAVAGVLHRYGAELTGPRQERFGSAALRVGVRGALPGPAMPGAAEVVIDEIWRADLSDGYRLAEYRYEFIERPMNRRRAFHRHNEAQFLTRFAVAVHEHCEERLGSPACSHYYGLPVDAFEAIRRFTIQWGQPGPIGCGDLRCMP